MSLGVLGCHFGPLLVRFGTLWVHFCLLVVRFGVNYGCVKFILVSFCNIFGKQSFSQ